MVDETTLNQFLGKILGDLGGAFSVPMVRMGDKLGLYKAFNGRAAIGDWRGPWPPAAERRTVERHAAFESSGLTSSRSRTAAGSRWRTPR